LASHFQPRFVGNLEVHDGKEWVNLILLLDDAVIDLFIVNNLALSLLFSRHEEDGELRSELKDLHLLVDFHVSVLLSHASVEQLVEIDIANIGIDGHFENLFLKLSIVEVFLAETKTVILVTEIAKSPEKACKLIFFDFVALVSVLSKLFPDLHEAGKIILEFGNHVFFWKIVLFELLNNNQNE
jgi:hypothetical protein